MKKYFKLFVGVAVSCAILVQPAIIGATNTVVIFTATENTSEIFSRRADTLSYPAPESLYVNTYEMSSNEVNAALQLALESARRVPEVSAYRVTGELQAGIEIDINSDMLLITNTTTNHDFEATVDITVDNTKASADKSVLVRYNDELAKLELTLNEMGVFVTSLVAQSENLHQILGAGSMLFDVNKMLNVENIVRLENYLTVSNKTNEDDTAIYVLEMSITEERLLDIIDMHDPEVRMLLLDLGVTASEMSNIYEMLRFATVNMVLVQHIDADTLLPTEGSVSADLVVQRSFLTITANAEGTWEFQNFRN